MSTLHTFEVCFLTGNQSVKPSPVIWYCVFFLPLGDSRLQRFGNGTPVPPCGVHSHRSVFGGQSAVQALVSNRTTTMTPLEFTADRLSGSNGISRLHVILSMLSVA